MFVYSFVAGRSLDSPTPLCPSLCCRVIETIIIICSLQPSAASQSVQFSSVRIGLVVAAPL